jgi:hypothetical protein
MPGDAQYSSTLKASRRSTSSTDTTCLATGAKNLSLSKWITWCAIEYCHGTARCGVLPWSTECCSTALSRAIKCQVTLQNAESSHDEMTSDIAQHRVTQWVVKWRCMSWVTRVKHRGMLSPRDGRANRQTSLTDLTYRSGLYPSGMLACTLWNESRRAPARLWPLLGT